MTKGNIRAHLPLLLFGAIAAAGLLVVMMVMSVSKPLVIKEIEGQYAGDFADDRVLVGASTNVFIGKVIEQAGNRERGIGPETQFTVEIVQNIKGKLQGTILLDQLGGYREGTLYKPENGAETSEFAPQDYVLKPGSTYIFATRFSEENDWYTLNPFPTATALLTNDSNASGEVLSNLADSNVRVKQLRAAYVDEKPLPEDIAHNNTPNSYRSAGISTVSDQ
jgi:hypothetical protein